MAQLVKNPPAMQETWVQSLSWEDPLEKRKATQSWPGESHGLYSPWGHKELDMTEKFSLSFSLSELYKCSAPVEKNDNNLKNLSCGIRKISA